MTNEERDDLSARIIALGRVLYASEDVGLCLRFYRAMPGWVGREYAAWVASIEREDHRQNGANAGDKTPDAALTRLHAGMLGMLAERIETLQSAAKKAGAK